MTKPVQPLNHQRVLLIEESPYIREALEDTLRAHGIGLRCVESGEEGMRAMSQHCFSAVVCNYHLPGIDGLEFFWNTKDLFKNTVSILTVSSGDDYLANVALKSGVDYFLEMPFKVEDLVGCIGNGKPASEGEFADFGFLANIQNYSSAPQLWQQTALPETSGAAAQNTAVRVTRVINKSGGILKVFHNEKTINSRRIHHPNLKLIKCKGRETQS